MLGAAGALEVVMMVALRRFLVGSVCEGFRMTTQSKFCLYMRHLKAKASAEHSPAWNNTGRQGEQKASGVDSHGVRACMGAASTHRHPLPANGGDGVML